MIILDFQLIDSYKLSDFSSFKEKKWAYNLGVIYPDILLWVIKASEKTSKVSKYWAKTWEIKKLEFSKLAT